MRAAWRTSTAAGSPLCTETSSEQRLHAFCVKPPQPRAPAYPRARGGPNQAALDAAKRCITAEGRAGVLSALGGCCRPANLMISGNLNADAEQLYQDSGIIKVSACVRTAMGWG